MQLISITAVMLLAFSASLGMAFNIDAIALSFGTSNTLAGLVASAEMASIAVGTLVFAKLAPRMNARRIYTAGVLFIVFLNLLSVFVTNAGWLLACRVPAGFALGAVVATVMGTAGRSNAPEYTFGVINAMVAVMGMFIAFVLPRALNMHTALPSGVAWSELDGLYIVYALCSVCAIFFIRTTPIPKPVRLDSSRTDEAPPLFIGWLALAGLGVVFFGHGTLALFMVKIGRSIPLTPETIGYVFMVASGFGIAAPLIVGYLGSRMSVLWPLAIILGVLGVSALGLASARTAMQFYLMVPLFAILPTAMMPFYLGALARLDASGSLTGAHPAFVLIGGAVAPFVGGALSDFGGFTTNGWFVVACVVLGAVLGYPALRVADSRRWGAA
jgi:predicted MFS family arabinose efflux permease